MWGCSRPGVFLGSGLIMPLSSSLSVMTSKTLSLLSLMPLWFPSSEPERFHVILFAGEAAIGGIWYNVHCLLSFCAHNIRVSLFVHPTG